jgi:hypothetical protein
MSERTPRQPARPTSKGVMSRSYCNQLFRKKPGAGSLPRRASPEVQDEGVLLVNHRAQVAD